MGFSMRIVHWDGTDIVLPKKHDIAGGTYAIGGTASAWLYVTYNYAPIFFRVIGEGGIRSLHGMELREATPILDRAIAALGDAEAPSAKASEKELVALFSKAIPNYDADRFYVSHMRKVIDWYSQIVKYASLDFVKEEEQDDAEKEA